MTRATPLKLLAALFLALLAAVLIGASLSVSLAWPLGFVALTPWLIASARVQLLLGFRLGVVVAVFGGLGFGFWLPGSLSSLLDIHLAWAWAATVAIGLVTLAVFWAPFSLWISWASRRGHFNPWLIAGAWAFCTHLYGMGPLPWGLLAYSQPPGALILQIADLLGPSGVEAALALTSAFLACALVPALRPHNFARHVLIALVLAGVGCAYAAARLAQDFQEGRPIEVALVQPQLDPDKRWLAAFQVQNLDHHLKLSRIAETSNPEIVFWPEFSVVVPLPANARVFRQLKTHSQQMSAALVLGAPFAEPGHRERSVYNSAFLLHEGQLLDRYDKVKLVRITERNLLPRFMDDTPDAIRAGGDPTPLEFGDTNLGVTICWDAMYPDVFRSLAQKGAGVMANISRDARFESQVAARQILRAAALRAVESRRYMVRPTAGGFSALIDPQGRLLEIAPYGEATVIHGRVHSVSGLTLYHRWGDLLPWLGGLIAIVWPLMWRPSTRESATDRT